jgi:hypothetical protein
MTVKRIPSADSPGDFVGRGGLGAGGGRTYTGSTGGKSIITGKKSSLSRQARAEKARERTKADDAAYSKHKEASKKKYEDKRKARELARQKELQQKIKTLKAAGKVEKKDFVVERWGGKVRAVYTSRAAIEGHRKMDNYEKAQKFREKASSN